MAAPASALSTGAATAGPPPGASAAFATVPASFAAEEQETQLERTEPDQLLALVTKDAALEPLDYTPQDLTDWREGTYELRAEVVDRLEDLFAAAEDDGHRLRVVSGYRSYRTQVATHQDWVRTKGPVIADRVSARPGHSEHQTGLAVDLDSVTGTCYLDACFGGTPEGEWLAEHAHEHGFIIRYPAEATGTTGYAYEPWHLRYIGPQAADRMHRRGIATLEEYLDDRRPKQWLRHSLRFGLRAV